MNTTRTYTMRARADAVAQTRRQILDAAWSLSEETLTLAIGLADVAERAGVTVRTVLRHFGSREGLFDAVAEHARGEISTERETPVGDGRAAVRTVVGGGAVVVVILVLSLGPLVQEASSLARAATALSGAQ